MLGNRRAISWQLMGVYSTHESTEAIVWTVQSQHYWYCFPIYKNVRKKQITTDLCAWEGGPTFLKKGYVGCGGELMITTAKHVTTLDPLRRLI